MERSGCREGDCGLRQKARYLCMEGETKRVEGQWGFMAR